MPDDVKANIEVTSSYDGSGIEAAKADAEGLNAIAKSMQESIGGASDAMKQLDSGASDAVKALVPLNDETAKMADAFNEAGTIVEEINDNLGDHVQALQAAQEGQKQLSQAVQETAKQLQIASPQVQQLTEAAQNLSANVQPAVDSFNQLQAATDLPQIPEFIQHILATREPVQHFAQNLDALQQPAQKATAQVTELNDALQQQQELLSAGPEQLQLPAAAAQRLAESMLPPDIAAQLSSAVKDNWVPPEIPVKIIPIPDLSGALSREQLTPQMADQFVAESNAIESTATVLPLQEGSLPSLLPNQMSAIDEMVRQQKAMQILQNVGSQALEQAQSQATESINNLNEASSSSNDQLSYTEALKQKYAGAGSLNEAVANQGVSSAGNQYTAMQSAIADAIRQQFSLPENFPIEFSKNQIDPSAKTVAAIDNYIAQQQQIQDQSGQTAQAIGGLQQATQDANDTFSKAGNILQSNVVPPLDQATKSANNLNQAIQQTPADIVNNALGIDPARNQAIRDQMDQNPFASNPPDWKQMGTTLTPDQLSVWQQFAGATGNPIPQQIADAINNLNTASQQTGNTIANNLTPPMKDATQQANDFNTAFSNLTNAQQQAYTGGQPTADFFASLNAQQQAQWAPILGLDANGNPSPSGGGGAGGQQRSFQQFFNSLSPEQQDAWKQYAGAGGALPPGVNPTDLGGSGGGGNFFSDLLNNAGDPFQNASDFFSGAGGAIGDVGMAFDTFMRPIMMAQMAAQLGTQFGNYIYAQNLAYEGSNASSPGSFTSQMSDVTANLGQQGQSFAVGFGSSLLPSLNAWNDQTYGSGTGTGSPGGAGGSTQKSAADYVGQFLGGATGLLADAGLTALSIPTGGLGSLIGMFQGNVTGNPLYQAGLSMFTAGHQGATNTLDQLFGLPEQYKASNAANYPDSSLVDVGYNLLNQPVTSEGSMYSPYYGMSQQQAQSAYNISHYGGTFNGTSWVDSGPTSPMEAYEHAVAVNTASPGSMMYPAPTADIGADWQYFNSMPIGGGPISSYQQQYATGPGGTYTQQDVANQMNQAGTTPFSRFIDSLFSGQFQDAFGGGASNNATGGASAADWTTQTAIPAIQKGWSSFTQGISDWWNSIGTGQATPYQGNISGGCFVAGTLILLPNLSEKPIEEVKINDFVLDYRMKPVRVSHVHIFAAKQTYKLTFSNKTIVVTTDSHPFLTTSGWKSLSPLMTKQESPELEVEELHTGDTIYTFDDVCELLSIEKQEIQQVYNITVEKTHTYFANKLVTHNIKGGATFTPSSSGSMSTGGIGSEAVQLTHTFTANVQWEANNLQKQFTAVAQWAANNLQKGFTAVANWAEQGTKYAAKAIATWVEQGTQFAAKAIATWTEIGTRFSAIAQAIWTEMNTEFNAIAQAVWSEMNTIYNAVARVIWNAENLIQNFVAKAEWGAENLIKQFVGKAEWAAEGLEHTFTGIANWVSSNLNPTFFVNPNFTMLAEGTENFAGGPALVAEAGSPEVVAHNGNYTLYDKPTFLDLPPGSSVLPLRSMPSSSSLAMYGQGTGGDNHVLPLNVPLGMTGQTANIHLYLDSQPFIQALSVPLSQNIRLNMGLRAY